jgi:hypothetical protein
MLEARDKTGPFESSWRKIARSEEHFHELELKINEFVHTAPYVQVVEPHPQKPGHVIHKMKLTQTLPGSLGEIAGDIVHNLRSALDNAGYTIAAAIGKPDAKYCAFPFAGSLSQMASSVGRSKDLPNEIQSLFVGFQPYHNGDNDLWALNEMCNADKHKMLTPIGTGVVRQHASVHGKGYFSMPDPHVWNRDKNEMDIITLGPDTEFKYDFQFQLFVAVNGIKVVDGKPVRNVLYAMGCKAFSVVETIEAESRRLGFVK